jgi:two-component system sensor histidine kinase KdpD
VRYNHAGGWVRVTVEPDGAHVRVRVTDSGPGIPSDLLARIFVPFDRLGEQERRGTGLGMALARGLTEAMYGALSVRSTPGEGTTTEVRLPAATG